MMEGLGDLPPFLQPDLVITMPFRGEEFPISSTYEPRDDLPWVISVLRDWLADKPRFIRMMEEHLDMLQRPEEMARLGAVLAAEREERWAHPDDSSSDDKPSLAITAEQVVANQRDEMERIRQLTHEVEQGLKVLEAAHPEAVAALPAIADEIARKRTREDKN